MSCSAPRAVRARRRPTFAAVPRPCRSKDASTVRNARSISARRSTSASVKYLGMLLHPPRVGFATHGTAADDAADTMGFLVAHILFVVGFALALRRAQTRGYDFFLMTGTNYATGLVIGAVWLAVAGAASVDLATVLLGIVQGARFSLAVVAIYLLLVRTGVGITFVLLRMAVIVPTVASIVWFGERPDLPTLLGIGLMLAALPLLTRGGRSDDARLRVWWYWPVVVGTLTVTGAGLIAAKAFVEVAPIENLPLYAMTTFAAATTVALATFAVRRRIQPALSPTVDRPAARGFEARALPGAAGSWGGDGRRQHGPAGSHSAGAARGARHGGVSGAERRLRPVDHHCRIRAVARAPHPRDVGGSRAWRRPGWCSSASESGRASRAPRRAASLHRPGFTEAAHEDHDAAVRLHLDGHP